MKVSGANVVVGLYLLVIPGAHAGEALMAAIGDINQVSVSQTGYCGDRQSINPSDWQRFTIQGEQQAWLFAKAVFRTGKQRSVCTIERTFMPKTGEAYILRVDYIPKDCKVELYQAVPASDPVRIRSDKASQQSCEKL